MSPLLPPNIFQTTTNFHMGINMLIKIHLERVENISIKATACSRRNLHPRLEQTPNSQLRVLPNRRPVVTSIT